jgi:hypothetical protein
MAWPAAIYLAMASSITRRADDAPAAFGEHLMVSAEPRVVDYVTGAAVAIRRSVFHAIGWFDEEFYPACTKSATAANAPVHGFGSTCACRQITHLRSNRERRPTGSSIGPISKERATASSSSVHAA